MLRFHPAGFIQKPLTTDLGVMVYYTKAEAPAIGTPTLVFLHSLGGGSSAFEWCRVYPALADTYRVVAPDLIGWGQSSHPLRTYRVEDYFTMITQLLTSLEGPRLVAATSLTAGVMVRLAIQRPDLCQGLFLVSPAGNSDFGRDYRLSLPALLASTPGVDRLLYQVGAANPLAVQWFLSNVLLGDRRRLTPTLVQAYLSCTQQPQAQYTALASLSGAISFDLANYIGQLSLPTAVILGEKSRFMPPAVGRRLASLNPQAITTIHEIPDAGVLPHLECPEAVVPLLRDFAGMVLASHEIR